MNAWQRREAARGCLLAELIDHRAALRAADAAGDRALAFWWSRRIDTTREKIAQLDRAD